MTTTRLLEITDYIQYKYGVISDPVDVTEPEDAIAEIGDNFEVIETGLKGWGPANAVIKYDGDYYLARVQI